MNGLKTDTIINRDALYALRVSANDKMKENAEEKM